MLHDGRSARVAVVGGSRIPFSARILSTGIVQELMTATLQGLVTKFDLRGQTMGDIALGAVIKHSRDWNLARESVIDSGLSLRTPAVDLQRACGTSVEAAVMIANKIALGQIDCGIAGGTDTVSDAPIVYRDEFRRILLDVHAARSFAQRIALVSPAAEALRSRVSGRHRATHRVVDGREHGDHGQTMGRAARTPGSARFSQPRQGRCCIRCRLVRRSRHSIHGLRGRQQHSARHDLRETADS